MPPSQADDDIPSSDEELEQEQTTIYDFRSNQSFEEGLSNNRININAERDNTKSFVTPKNPKNDEKSVVAGFFGGIGAFMGGLFGLFFGALLGMIFHLIRRILNSYLSILRFCAKLLVQPFHFLHRTQST